MLKAVRTLLTYIPTKRRPVIQKHDASDLGNILPKKPSRTYDVKQVVTAITDHGSFFETQRCFFKNIITGFFQITRVFQWSCSQSA
ncbi:carboxyl transferase domain-containing protein [Bacillus aerius]|uniref:carboxyl transferase domain-containing protein n=1 Tax=Bacillus aerius TaxID=293388 RepID=UPI0040378DBB